MTILDRMNENFTSSIGLAEMGEIADFVNGLNRLDQETWERMREDMAND